MTEYDPGAGDQLGTTGASKVIVDATIDVAAALAGVAVPPLAPWLAGGATFVKAMGPRLNEHQDRNLDLLMLQARASSGMEFDDFASTIENDPERMLHFIAACDAARRTALDEKIKALGRAVGDLARDDALVDESAIWISIFSQIEAPHVRIVLALFEDDPEYPEARRSHLWKRSALGERVGLSFAISILINTLTSLGLMEEIRHDELDTSTRARWGVSSHNRSYIPIYGKGPLADEFLERLQITEDAANGGGWAGASSRATD